LLHLVGYLYYWQMGFNSVFKGLIQILRDVGKDKTITLNYVLHLKGKGICESHT
jgi:hypothetical protein